MTRQDYLEEIKEEITNHLEYNDIKVTTDNREDLEQDLYDELFVSDVTGNASGSYTFNSYQAEENICHAWDLIEEAAAEFGIEPIVSSDYDHGAEYWDVTIRCYLLGEALAEVLDEVEVEEEDEDQEATVIEHYSNIA